MRAFFISAAVAVTAGGASAAPPQADGREATPVEREFYIPPPDNNAFPRPMPKPDPKGVEDEVRDAVRELLARVGL